MRFLVLNSDAERRDGLKTLLRQIDRHAGYNDAKDWRQAQRLIKQQSFDLIAVDWQDIKRLGDLHALCRACAPTPVAALTDDASPEHAQALFDAGVLGVIPRSTRPHLIVRALEMVLLGGHYIPPSALNLTEPAARARDGRVDAIVSQLPRRKRSACSLLSPRQAQIMRFVHMGSTNKMIARTLGISEGTVKIHLASIFQQLGATNRAAAVAIYNGWLPPHLEVLLSARDSSPKPVHGAAGSVPLRPAKTQHRYPLVAENESSAQPLIAAEPGAPFKANE
ncbi:response regulator transcription factor [Burkholderia oklahomensis]|uniref:Bacterial regulatory s, luxR family protein n=1 Tax=Burkholderia oklahomensis TaxID=342113 RepID=A0AAI8B5C6_9BURK|nr:response regulator transcription factor [Burkholderia oklahomensis]AIO66037.1 bacterial regulatory s, luxR family protein [Burkholderia oklahomensis]AJX31195.1 bacterial regulatory s, luxR family protein [Burkholderia oklahomensis C6786]AOI42984.1 helix-turn-helix transcriptional regulator [Burkholderia oklahomensis EO147]AOI46541.1 helix-turn-helix transcriptional regulator [Burkholderia oklahomensis C6786]KUY57996.1 helix-turn-helix transcriptional regulator [Burkholderia oklahomensis EO1